MLEIRQVPMGGDVRDFLDVVSTIYKNEPNFIRPLDQDLKDRLNPKKNPLFDHAEGTIFLAYKGGKCVGRITATIDHEHLARYNDATGFWGFFDTIDDDEVARELIARAEAWLKGKGMTRARGPISMSINEEMGCLVEGFDSPAVFLNPHHHPYQAALIEKAGYAKVKDVLGWHYTVGELNTRAKKGHDEILALPEIKSRTVSLKDVERDVGIIVDVFNDAWCENWGFVPLTKKEVAKMASDFKLILEPEITRIVTIDGEPAAVAVALPNLNEIARDLDGKLFPFGWAKLIWRLKFQPVRSGRVPLMGVKKKFARDRRGMMAPFLLIDAIRGTALPRGLRRAEYSWILEDNRPMRHILDGLSAHVYKTYRIYQKQIGPGAPEEAVP